ncbi:MAG TPA: hypothetical protein VF952_18405 [Chloroflexia bacterium]|jgi:hypothetical protein
MADTSTEQIDSGTIEVALAVAAAGFFLFASIPEVSTKTITADFMRTLLRWLGGIIFYSSALAALWLYTRYLVINNIKGRPFFDAFGYYVLWLAMTLLAISLASVPVLVLL